MLSTIVVERSITVAAGRSDFVPTLKSGTDICQGQSFGKTFRCDLESCVGKIIDVQESRRIDDRILENQATSDPAVMTDATDSSGHIQICLDRLRAGDESAQDELIHRVCGRMERLARTMLGNFPGVRRWEMTDDVLQNSTIRLLRALKVVTPETPRSFFNFAAEQIRRELIDLARHYGGPEGIGARHDSQADGFPHLGESPGSLERSEDTHDPVRLAFWTEFHRAIERLPDQEKEVFNLIWYEGMSQAEAGQILGVSERSIKWRWRGARLKLHENLSGGPLLS